MNIAILWVWNIWTTIIKILLKYKKQLWINNIFAIKHKKNERNKYEQLLLKELWIKFIFSKDIEWMLLSKNIWYVFDCVWNKTALDRKLLYKKLNIKSCSQGSETWFWIPYMLWINDDIIKTKQFIEVVSCNTHGWLSLLKTFWWDNFSNIISADFVTVRRSDDLSNNTKVVWSNIVSRHLDSKYWTHHWVDIKRVLETLNIEIPLMTSDITTPSQLLHMKRFSITFKKWIWIDEIYKYIHIHNVYIIILIISNYFR